jgi:hypothetical protein
MRIRTLKPVGAAALAIATAVSGLAIGPVAAAAPPLSPATPAGETTIDTTSTRTVGKLAIVVSSDAALDLQLDPDAMRTGRSGTVAQALAAADYWSVPAVGQVGPVRGVGAQADRCMTHSTTYPTYQTMQRCSDAASQNWQWVTTTAVQGHTHALVPSTATSRAVFSRGENAYVHLTTEDPGRHTMALTGMTAERTLTASARVDPARFEVVITGAATTGATVSAGGASTTAGSNGAYTLRVNGLGGGDHRLTVSQSLPDGTRTGTATVDATIVGPPADARIVGPGVMQLAASGEDSFAALTVRADTLGYDRFDSYAAAAAAADDVELPALGASGPLRGTGSLRGRCIRHDELRPSQDNVFTSPCSSTADDQRWTWVPTTTAFGASRYTLEPVGSVDRGLAPKPGNSYLRIREVSEARPFVLTDSTDARQVTAEAVADARTGDVTLSGTATPHATIVVGEHETEVGADGSWTLVIDDLPGGRRSLTIEQTLTTGTPYDGLTIEVDVPRDHGTVAPLDSPGVELVRGGEGEVSFRVRSDRIQAGYEGAVTLTAPEGTVFPAQETARADWRVGDSGPYAPSPELLLRNGRVSDDGATLRFDWPVTQVGAHEFRYTVRLLAEVDAVPSAGGALGFVYTGTSAEGTFRASGETSVSVRDSYVDATLESPVDGDTFTPGPVEFRGTGTPGAEITVAPAGGSGVSTEVQGDGTWRVARWLGNGAAIMTVTHVAEGGRNTIENIRLYSDQAADGPLVLTSPAVGAGHDRPGFVTISGTGSTWSRITITDGTDAAPTTATVDYDGSWSTRRWIGTALTPLTVTSTRAGERNGLVERSFNTGTTERDFAVTSHEDGGTFTPGPVTISGTASTGDTVTLTAAGLPALEARADHTGRWAVDRWLGNGFITFTVTHQPRVGAETTQTLRLYSDQGTAGDFVVTTPVDGDRRDTPGFVTFSGRGTTWSTVSIADGRSAPTTASVQLDGSWRVDRWVGIAPTVFTVSSSRGGVENGSTSIEFNQRDAIRDFAVTSHTDGGTFTPGAALFTGTGSTGDTVTLTAAGLPPLEATVDRKGEWSVGRYLGNGAITFTVVHTPVTGQPTTRPLRLFSDQAVSGPLVVTGPASGDGHDSPGFVTFTGTGTTWSTISIGDGTNAAPSTVTVGHGGTWSVRRWIGTDPVTLSVTSSRADIPNGSVTVRYNDGR